MQAKRTMLSTESEANFPLTELITLYATATAMSAIMSGTYVAAFAPNDESK